MNTKISKKGVFSKPSLLISALFFFASTALFPLIKTPVSAAESSLNLHLFSSKTCPHCRDEKIFLGKMAAKYSTLIVNEYEITENKSNLKLFAEVSKKFDDGTGGVPFLVIGEENIVGFLNEETTGVEIEQKIMTALYSHPTDLVSNILQEMNLKVNKPKETPQSTTSINKFEVSFPFLGKVDVNSLTLPAMTVILGLIDGFNPCAMWSLLFLISLLLGMKNRAKMWLLGSLFIGTSGLVYFLFMAAWLNFFLIIGYATIVRVGIGVAATALGGYHIWKYWKDYKAGCLVEGDENRQETFNKIRKYAQNEHILLAIGGIILLAAAVNVVELLCSAGLPAIYTKALTMTQMPSWKYYLYLLGYVFFYMLDDMVIFIIAMVTFNMVGIKQSYAKYSNILGGIIMFMIGILMLFKPELLMFS